MPERFLDSSTPQPEAFTYLRHQIVSSYNLDQRPWAVQLVRALGDIVAVLRDADPDDKAEVYRQLGLRLTYQTETQTVRAAINLSAHRGQIICVRGGT